MDNASLDPPSRRPRFRRAAEPPAFRLTSGDVEIIRLVARHRFLRSTHIAALVGRSLDRTNDRLSRLFHASYLDRPRAQLDYYPTSGSAPMAYALAQRGAEMLEEFGICKGARSEWSRKNGGAGRPFIEHQLEIVEFQVALERGVCNRSDIRLISSDELIAAFPRETRSKPNPLSLRVAISHEGKSQEISVIPDLIFGLGFRDGSRRCFMVEIDRGTMPISRTDITQTSFERKMRAYLAAYAATEHERRFAWKNFRVLTVTASRERMNSMVDALQKLSVPHSPGPVLFLFALRGELHDPVAQSWQDGYGRMVGLT